MTTLPLRRSMVLLVIGAAVAAGALAFHMLTPHLRTEPAFQSGEWIPVPWHTSTRLVALDLKWTGPDTVEILTRRDGKTGTTYTLRVIDCVNRTFSYLGEGTSEAVARAGNAAETPMSPPKEGSIPWQVAADACPVDKAR